MKMVRKFVKYIYMIIILDIYHYVRCMYLRCIIPIICKVYSIGKLLYCIMYDTANYYGRLLHRSIRGGVFIIY